MGRIVSMVLSNKNDKPDPDAEKFIHWSDMDGGYRLNKGIKQTEELETMLDELGYVYLNDFKYYIYDELNDSRTELHKEPLENLKKESQQ